MSTAEQSFYDTFHFKMDPKGRVAIPAEWRGEVVSDVRMLVAKCYGVPNLRVLTPQELATMKETIESMDWQPARKRRMMGKLASRVKLSQINSQGKLQVPKPVVAEMEFSPGTEHVLVGRETYFEIYTVENYQRMVEIENEDTEIEDDETGIFS